MTPGIYTLTAKEYHSSIGVSKSMLDRLHPTPLHFKSTPAKRADYFDFGECLHSLLLEKEDRFHLQPEYRDEAAGLKWNNNATVCRKWNDDHADKPILTAAETGMVRAMASAVHTHPFCGPVLAGAKVEQSIFAEDPATKLLLRCRPDVLPVRGRIRGINPLVDVKTAKAADKRSFERSIHARRYHVQAAFYLYVCELAGMDFDSFIFIVVEKHPPYAVAVYDLDPESIRQGKREFIRDLNVYQRCIETNQWPGYNERPELISLPEYGYDPEMD